MSRKRCSIIIYEKKLLKIEFTVKVFILIWKECKPNSFEKIWYLKRNLLFSENKTY